METFLHSGAQRRRVLVVDDEFINRELLGAILSQNYEVVYAENGRQAIELMRSEEPAFSLVLLDLMMPLINGFELLEMRKTDEQLKASPVIVITSEKKAEVKSIRMGAADFIAKPYDMPDVILARCERVIELNEDRSIIRDTERDALTGLYSREYFFEYVRKLVPRMKNEMDAVVLNIDRFSFIRELFGRQEGDRVLSAAAYLIEKRLLNGRGIACRRGTDSFCAYCERRVDYEKLLRDINKELAQRCNVKSVHMRAGIYPCDDSVSHAELWFDRAKTACDRVRGDYNRCTELYSREMHERSVFQERLIADVDKAIKERQFTVFYQPKYRVQGSRPELTSAEALVRWKHPELGMISPADFIPLFEENGLICRVDRFVWREAASQIKQWKEQYSFDLPVSVNVSRVDVYDERLEGRLTDILEEFGLSADEFMPEITESAYADNGDRLIGLITSLRSKGFKIEMDDFGSGYSSLNMLTSIPIDVLKMDMKFVRNMLRDEKSRLLVGLVIDIARFLKVPVVAEGVEEQEQLDALRDMGCEIVQGYYFSAPVPPGRFAELIEKEIKERSNRGVAAYDNN